MESEVFEVEVEHGVLLPDLVEEIRWLTLLNYMQNFYDNSLNLISVSV